MRFPSSGPVTRIFLGDSPFGDFNPSRVEGIAPHDLFNSSASDVGAVYVDNIFRGFVEQISDPSTASLTEISDYVSVVVAHEIAHTFGLSHIYNATRQSNDPLLIMSADALLRHCAPPFQASPWNSIFLRLKLEVQQRKQTQSVSRSQSVAQEIQIPTPQMGLDGALRVKSSSNRDQSL